MSGMITFHLSWHFSIHRNISKIHRSRRQQLAAGTTQGQRKTNFSYLAFGCMNMAAAKLAPIYSSGATQLNQSWLGDSNRTKIQIARKVNEHVIKRCDCNFDTHCAQTAEKSKAIYVTWKVEFCILLVCKSLWRNLSLYFVWLTSLDTSFPLRDSCCSLGGTVMFGES